jgi:hypothetical protein
MATKINGAVIGFGGYEYGVALDDGTVVKCVSFDEMYRINKVCDAPMRFRAVYVTDWWVATDASNDTATD